MRFRDFLRATFNPASVGAPSAEPLPTFRAPVATWTGVVVSESTTLALPAVWRCIEIIAGKIASMPIHAFKNGEQVPTPKLLEQPNPHETRFDTIYRLVASLLLRGNAYAALGGFTQLGYPTILQPLHVDTVAVWRGVDGSIYYWVSNGTETFQLDQTEIMHCKGLIVPGMLHGLGVIEYQREAIGQGLALQEYGSRFFSENVTPNVAITVPGAIDQDNADNLRERFVAKHSGRSREPLILSNGMGLETYTITPKDAQFIEAQHWSAQEVCTAFGVPGHFVGISNKDSLTYTNAELEGINLANNTLDVWCNRLEQVFSGLLPRGTEAKFYRDALLKADTASRYAAYASAIGAGWMLPNEVRAKENLEPLEEEVAQPDAAEDIDDLDVNGADDENQDLKQGDE